MKKNMAVELFFLWLIIGGVYYMIEGVWHICSNGGWANIIMMPIGGVCGVLVGSLNQIPGYCKNHIFWQSLIGTLIVLSIEFITGYILNIRLGLGIWDYSGLPLNIMGQVSLYFGFLWFLLMPLCIWFDDFLRYSLWFEGKYYPPLQNYKRLFSFNRKLC